ncbi:type I restriction-modification system S subunit [Mammaliicoccus lentus]|uniref:restriction endonuclease subunit S n=1 Tax=Mammaliicoccus lentus TaxID=42858 RepID=UPI00085C6808|nr:restriction endonuclease subunit S [Mammaliicoccus lentus]SCT99944.1 type I restriction-modification system S subunit [Mammaliicoccus lentus]
MKFNTFQNRKPLKSAKQLGWNLFILTDLLKDDSRNVRKIKKSDYLENGQKPIIDQGKQLIGGYTNLDEGFYNEESYIVFGDHTRIIKYIDFPSFIGADGVKVLRNKNREIVDTKYLYYFLQSINIPDAGYSRHFKFLKEVIVPVPPQSVQLQIVNTISKVHSITKKREQQIEALTALKQSLFYEMYLNNVIDKKQNKMKDLIIESRNGLSRRGNDDSGEIVLKLRDIRDNTIDFTNLNRISLTEKEKESYSVNKQDLLLVRVNGNPDYVGRSAIFEGYKESVYFNDHIIRLKLNNDINVGFLSYYLNSRYGLSEFAKQIKTSAGQYTINRKGIDNVNITYPDLSIQNKLIINFKEIDKRINNLESSLSEMKRLYDSLLHKAFNGELFKEEINA